MKITCLFYLLSYSWDLDEGSTSTSRHLKQKVRVVAHLVIQNVVKLSEVGRGMRI